MGTSPATPRRDSLPSRRGVRSLLSSLVEPVESPVASTAAPTTSPTNTGSDTPRYSSSRSWLTVSTHSGRRISSCRRNTDSKYNTTLIPSLTLWAFSMFWTHKSSIMFQLHKKSFLKMDTAVILLLHLLHHSFSGEHVSPFNERLFCNYNKNLLLNWD